MGNRYTWSAVRGPSVTDVLDAIAPKRVVASYRADAQLHTGLYCIEARDRWVICLGSGNEHTGKVGEAEIKQLSSASTEGLVVSVSDSVMVSSIDAYRDGRKTWQLSYSGQKGFGEPNVIGQAPDFVPLAIAEANREQANDDADDAADHLYDIAANIGYTLTGFRYDDPLDGFLVHELEEPPRPERTLSIAGSTDLIEPTRSQVLASIAAVEPTVGYYVRLGVETRLARGQLIVCHERGQLRIESLSHEGRYFALRRDEAPLDLANVTRAFADFYDQAQRSTSLRWLKT